MLTTSATMAKGYLAAALMTSTALAAKPPLQPIDASSVTRSTGRVSFNIATGSVDGHVCVSNWPAGTAGTFTLNAGLNVARITNEAGQSLPIEGWYNPGVDGETLVYTVATKPVLLCIQYVGAFPVYTARDAPTDFKGIMAFNGDSARFTEQSAWLPTPYDPERKVRVGDTAYDLEVACVGCRFLYLNGSAAVDRSHARFTSLIPRPPLLFGGTGPITNTLHITILNETVAKGEANALSAAANTIDAFYQNYMGQPVEDRPVFLRMEAIDQVARDRAGWEWGFATWPTIAMSGSVGKVGSGLLKNDANADRRVAYIAHEMAHFYFGTVKRPRGAYFWFLLESTAEFMAIKALQSIRGDAAASIRISALQERVAEYQGQFLPLDRINNVDEIGETYRYSYGPLLLLSLEKRIGLEKMQAFMRNLVSAPDVLTWADLEAKGRVAGIDPIVWDRWRVDCVASTTVNC